MHHQGARPIQSSPVVGYQAPHTTALLALAMLFMGYEFAIHGLIADLRGYAIPLAALAIPGVLASVAHAKRGPLLLWGFAATMLGTIGLLFGSYAPGFVDVETLHRASDYGALGTAALMFATAIRRRMAGTSRLLLCGGTAFLACCAGPLVLAAAVLGVMPFTDVTELIRTVGTAGGAGLAVPPLAVFLLLLLALSGLVSSHGRAGRQEPPLHRKLWKKSSLLT